MKVERLLAIVIKMLNNKRITAKELAEYFEVSVRTIQRDIEAISIAGIPIVSYKGQNGGYGIMEDYLISKSFFSDTEQELLLTTLNGVYKAYEDRGFKDIIDKLLLLKTNSKVAKSSNLIMDFSPWGSSERIKSQVDMLRNAIESSKVIVFDYIDINGYKTQRKVEPAALLLKVNTWYLQGYCTLRKNFRLFKLSRIRELKILTESFYARELPELNSIYEYNRKKVTLTLKFNHSALSRLDDYFEIEELDFRDDGYIYVTVEYPEDEWVYSMILSFGEAVEVMEPQHIREIIKSRCLNILNRYK